MNVINLRRYALNRQTEAKRIIWQKLKSRRTIGHRFRRHFPIGLYVVDFVCLEKKLIIQITETEDQEKSKQQQIRDSWLETHAFGILRFSSTQALQETQRVADAIRVRLLKPHSTQSATLG